jgi:N utilization substance protein B
MQTRRDARRLALQILFANEYLKEDIDAVAERVAKSLDVELSDFTVDLVRRAAQHEDEINQLIQKHLKNWDYQRVAIFDRVLIRLAISEMLYHPDIPVEVSINEALELTKDFSTNKSKRFINGVLDSVFHDLKKHHKSIKFKIPGKTAGKNRFSDKIDTPQ